MNNEIDIVGIIDIIFSGDQKPLKYYTLDFGITDKKELFELFLMIFTFSTKKFYGDMNGKVNLKNLSERDINKIKNYYNSFGVELTTKIYNESDYLNSDIIPYKELPITSDTKLEDLVFSLKCEDVIYTISFSLL